MAPIRRRTTVALTVATLAIVAVAAFAGGSAASASTGSTEIRAALNHGTVHAKTTATVAGELTPRLSGQVVTLQRYYDNAWHNITKDVLGSGGTFAFPVTGLGGDYIYRVVHPAQHGWHSSVTPNLTLHVQRLQTVTLANYTARVRVWNGPRVTIPTATYQVHWTNACFGPDNGLVIDWNGDTVRGNAGFEFYFGLTNADRSGTWTGHLGARGGTFAVSAYCPGWTLQVTYQAWR